jgi:hypothetical protein
VPVNAPARLFYGPKLANFADCVIQDVSDGGAKLEVAEIYVLPRRLVLLDYRQDVALDAVVRWRRWDTAGLSFEHRYDMRHPVDAWLLGVQEVWRLLADGVRPVSGGVPGMIG